MARVRYPPGLARQAPVPAAVVSTVEFQSDQTMRELQAKSQRTATTIKIGKSRNLKTA
jgi:hypothetical protein